jgi:esterase
MKFKMSTLEKFHFQIVGPASAPKLVFLHGVMGFAANFRRIAKAFESEFQVLLYDQRGHGRSFQPDSGYAPEDYAADLKDILIELGWDKINLVGHSMGGRVAYHFAHIYPERVTRLVIEDIGPSMHPTGASLVLRMLDAVPVPFPTKRDAKHWFDTEFLKIFADERQKEGLAAYLYANVIENERKEGVWRFSEQGIRESVANGRAVDRWQDIQGLTMPTLLIRGEFSRDLPRDLYDEVLRVAPNIEGVEIKGAGHWVHADQPDLFIEVLGRFFHGERQISAPGIEPAE